MQLRTGKIVNSGVTAAPAAAPRRPVSTIDTTQYMLMHGKHKEQIPKTTIALISGLVKSAMEGSKIERMLKISLIYDIILADKTFRNYDSHSRFMDVICREASKHMASVNSDEILDLLVTDELVAAHKHFRCILERFIERSFTTPIDYDEYSYHYDIMKKIGYESALHKRAEIANYSREVDHNEFLIGEYITNEVTVYELYALVTYELNEALPNNVSYDYCFETAVSWFI